MIQKEWSTISSKSWSGGGGSGDNLEMKFMLEKLQDKLVDLKYQFEKLEAEERKKVRRQKEERDYEIFPGIGYKFNSQSFTLQERHPMSKDRFQAVSEFIEQLEKDGQ